MIEGLVIDRSRITHGESKRLTLLGMKVQRLEKAMNTGEVVDLEEIQKLLDAADETLAKVVVCVPEGWLSDGVAVGDAGWLDGLSQVHYEEIMAAAQSNNEADAEKKG